MKILFVTPYITSDKHSMFLRNITGFGYMVYDIAKYVGKKNEVKVFVVNAIAPAIEMDTFQTIGKSWFGLIKAFSIKSLKDAIVFVKKYNVPIYEKIRIFYQYLAVAQIEKMMQDFDLIHIHGCSPITDAVIRACQRKQKSFLVTLHGLVSFEKSVRLHDSLKQYEKDFLIEAYENDYNVSFISTGNKETALDYVKSQIQA